MYNYSPTVLHCVPRLGLKILFQTMSTSSDRRRMVTQHEHLWTRTCVGGMRSMCSMHLGLF